MDKKPEKLVPEVRFKGFTDDWEQRKLGEAAEIIGGGTPSTQISNYWNGDINWYTPAEISNFIYTRKSKRKISMEGLENSSARLLPVGTVLFTSRAGIGKTAILSKEGTTNQGFQSIVPNKKLLDSYFIFSLTNELKKYGETHGAGSTFIEISGRELAKAPLKLPALKEQKKIGGLLHQVDELIFLQQRKLEILIKLKRSFLTKSMVNSLDKNPELYFNSASVKWLKQKLSDLTIKEFKGNTKLNDTKPGKTEYLDAERLNGNVPLFIDKPINTLKSDILILWDGSKAGSVYYGFEGSLGSTLKAIRLNPKLVNSFFVYQQLKSKQDVIFNKYRTPNIPHVIKNFTKVYPIYFPSMAVQNKIARFLGNLDTLIEIQQKSIKDHKVIKKYLLQKLFI